MEQIVGTIIIASVFIMFAFLVRKLNKRNMDTSKEKFLDLFRLIDKKDKVFVLSQHESVLYGFTGFYNGYKIDGEYRRQGMNSNYLYLYMNPKIISQGLVLKSFFNTTTGTTLYKDYISCSLNKVSVNIEVSDQAFSPDFWRGILADMVTACQMVERGEVKV